MLVALAPAAACGEDLLRGALELRKEYAGQLEELAAWCDAKGMVRQARATRDWLAPRDPNRLYVTRLPREIGPPAPAEGAPPGAVEWAERFLRLRRQQAQALEGLARKAVRADRASLAVELVLTAIRENPDHEGIRRLLGYQRFHDGWYTRYEVEKLRAGQVWHERFGWLPKNHVARYEKGERYAGGLWISAEEDARRRRTIETGWDIETEHYLIRTNHSREAGVALAVKLEQLFDVWRQLFIRYYASEAQVAEWFERGPPRRGPAPKFKVVLFRDRAEYVAALKPAFANIEITTGVYTSATRRAYFFAGGEDGQRDLFHEATHQLFHESRPVGGDVARRGNFWIIEGIAMYMETLRVGDEMYVLGGPDDVRMRAARYRLLHDKFYVPLEEFSGYGIDQLQSDPRIATLYSQAAGLTHFLIHYEHGRYRDALVGYLQAVYAGVDGPATLARLTGTSLAELDAQYAEYMRALPAEKAKPGGPSPASGRE